MQTIEPGYETFTGRRFTKEQALSYNAACRETEYLKECCARCPESEELKIALEQAKDMQHNIFRGVAGI